MRIEINWDVCESNGYCEATAPAVFHLNDDDTLQVLEGDVPAEQEDVVRKAAQMCPKQAIRLV